MELEETTEIFESMHEAMWQELHFLSAHYLI